MTTQPCRVGWAKGVSNLKRQISRGRINKLIFFYAYLNFRCGLKKYSILSQLFKYIFSKYLLKIFDNVFWIGTLSSIYSITYCTIHVGYTLYTVYFYILTVGSVDWKQVLHEHEFLVWGGPVMWKFLCGALPLN